MARRIIERICESCGEPYRRQGQRFCSNLCAGVAISCDIPEERLVDMYIIQQLTPTKIAEILGVAASTVMSRLKRYGISKRTASEAAILRSGKNGRLRKADGYVYLLKPGYYRTNIDGYIQEHIYVWEQHHNKQLPVGWIIHHLNGIRDDNRIENLKGMQRKKHHAFLYTQALQERIRELEKALEQWSPIALSSIGD